MKRRILLAILVCISLVLAVMIHLNGTVGQRRERFLALLETMPKTERERFNSNAMDFHQRGSKTAREERKRLRTLYYQIQNDPECDHLNKTMEQYVDWVNRVSDPAKMREIQSLAIDDRVEAVFKEVEAERQTANAELLSSERMRDDYREALPASLRDVSPAPIYEAFDEWLTQKYEEVKAKAGLNDDQWKQIPLLEKFYRDMVRRLGIETSGDAGLNLPEKMAMIQLVRNLSGTTQRSGSGGGGGFNRGFGGWRQFWAGGLREEFLGQTEEALRRHESNFPVKFDETARQTLESMNREERIESLQQLLALAVLERYPTMDQVDPVRFFQTLFRTDKERIEILGAYLSMMSTTKRGEFLKLDSRFAANRLQGELAFHAIAFPALLRTNRERPFGMGGPPGPPREGAPPPDAGPNGPPGPGQGPGVGQGGQGRGLGPGQGFGRGGRNAPDSQPD